MDFLRENLRVLEIAGALLLVVAVAYLGFVLFRARSEADAAVAGTGEGAGDSGASAPGVLSLANAFARTWLALRGEFASRGEREGFPLFLVLGDESSPSGAFASTVPLPIRFGAHLRSDDDGGLGWHFFERGGLVCPSPGLVFDGSDEGRSPWSHLLRGLSLFRPFRPLDGVVVSVSAESLLAMAAEESPERRTRRAATLRSRLRRLGERLGVRLPVYVVVTGCEELDGFPDHLAALSSEQRAEAMGWSSPHHVDVAFRDEWIEEALDAIGRRTLEVQVDLMTRSALDGEVAGGSAAAGDRDAMFLFGASLRRLREPVGDLLSGMFRDSALGEAGFFRGLYFTGVETDPPDQPATGVPPKRQAFAAGILRRVVFAEASLSLAIAQQVISRQRRVRWIRLAALVPLALALVLALRWRSIDRRQEEAVRHLTALTGDVTLDNSTSPSQWASDVLVTLDSIESEQLIDYMIPTSWSWNPWSLHRDVQDAITDVFQAKVLTALRSEMLHCAERVGSGYVAEGDCREAASDRGLSHTERLALYWWGYDAVSSNAARYNRLARRNSYRASDLAALVRFLLGSDIPSHVARSDHFYSTAVARVRGPLVSGDELGGGLRVAERLVSLYGAASEEVRRDAVELAEGLGRLDEVREDSLFALAARLTEIDDEYNRFRDISGRVHERRRSASIRVGRGSPGGATSEPRDTTLAGLDVPLTAIGPDLARIDSAFSAGLQAIHVDGIGALADASARLSPAVADILSLLRDFVEQGLVVEAPAENGSFGRTFWEPDSLVEAVHALEAFAQFEADYPAPRDRRLTNLLPSLSDATKAAGIRSRVRAAAFEALPPGPSPGAMERDLNARIPTLTAGAAPWSTLLDSLDALKFDDGPYRLLADGYVRTIVGVLDLARDLLYVREPYRLFWPALEGWTEGPLGTAILEVDDEADLPAFLDGERALVSRIAGDYAAPTRALLDSDGLASFRGMDLYVARTRRSASSVAFWAATDSVLAAYPADSTALTTLETFLAVELPAVTPATCLETVARYADTRGADIFSDRLASIATMVRTRCEELGEARATGQRTRVVSAMDSVRVMYPFSAPEAHADSLSVAAAADFLQRYGWAGAVPDSIDPTPIEGSDAVAGFLAGAIDTLGVDVEVTFRSPPADLGFANQVVEWQLWVSGSWGADTVSLHDPPGENRTTWRYGDAVGLRFRWAAGSPWEPDDGRVAPPLHVANAEHSLDLGIGGEWALPRLLRGGDLVAEPFRASVSRTSTGYRFVLLVPTVQRETRVPYPSPVSLMVEITLRDRASGRVIVPSFRGGGPSSGARP